MGYVSEAKIGDLKNNPIDLEKFVSAYERLKTLIEEDWKLKDALKSHMETGFKAESFTLVRVKDKEIQEPNVNPEEYLQKVVKEIGTMKAAGAIKVDLSKAKEIWSSYTAKPFPLDPIITITTKSGYSYIRAKK